MAISVVVTDSSVDIKVSGADRFWSLSRGRSVPIDEIVSARVAPRAEVVRRLRWRIGGTAFPRVIYAGHFLIRREGDERGLRAWVSIRRGPELLEIILRGRRPRLIALERDDAHDSAWFSGERLGRG